MKYQVGDKVLVRDWKAMEREYRVDDNDNIRTPVVFFTKDMRRFCGQRVTIMKKYDTCYIVKEDNSNEWTDEMLAHNFEYGEEIEVKDRWDLEWKKGIFVGWIDGAKSPYLIVAPGEDNSFKSGKQFQFYLYHYARKIRKPKIEITCKVDGKEVPVSEVFGKYLDRILESIKTEGGK